MHAWAKSSCLALGICLGLGFYIYICIAPASIVHAGFLQTSSTPAWTLWLAVFNVSKGVRLGCENLYGGTGGVCMEIWESRRLTFWELRNLEFWKSIDAYVCREIWDPATSKEINILKIKIRVAQNVGKVWISRKKNPGPLWGHLGPIFCVGRKNVKNR